LKHAKYARSFSVRTATIATPMSKPQQAFAPWETLP
jgi:hypothetical protein